MLLVGRHDELHVILLRQCVGQGKHRIADEAVDAAHPCGGQLRDDGIGYGIPGSGSHE